MDDTLRKYKKLFITVFIILAVLAIWHLTYVFKAANVSGDNFLVRDYGMLALGLTMLSLLVGIILLCLDKYKTITVWAVAFALLAISCMRVLPGLSAPDESTHYITAYYYSNYLMLQEPDNEEGRVYVRAADKALEDVGDESEAYLNGDVAMTEILGYDMSEKTYHDVKHWDEDHANVDGTAVSLRTRTETTPVVYIPQMIGITLARLLHVSPVVLITFGRVFNLAAFIAMVYWALKRMPFGQNVMMATTLFPMTIHIAASMSYDAMLIGASYMFIAEVLHLAYAADEVRWKDIILLAVILAVISPCKMVYGIAMIFLLLLIPKQKFGNRIAWAWIICALAVIIPLVAVNFKVVGTYAAATENNLVWAGEPGYTISYCLHHPMDTLKIVYNTIIYQGDYYYLSMMGAYLGNANPALDVPFIIISLLSAGTIILGLSEENRFKVREKIIIAIIAVVLFGLLLGSMLVGWTPLSSTVILGVQGRYFLPLLPMVILMLPNGTIKVNKDLSKIIIFLMVACDAYALFRLYSTICLNI